LNRRIIIDPQQEPAIWRTVSSVLVFLLALGVCILLSIDDVEGQRRPSPMEVDP
jgi:hypothetical protein